jgi:hypothetical protein
MTSPNFVTQQKNEFLRPRQCVGPKLLWTKPRSHLYRFQYQKKSCGVLKKVCRKKMFSSKSVTKLEALTVLYSIEDSPLGRRVRGTRRTGLRTWLPVTGAKLLLE